MTLKEKLLADSKRYCEWRGISLARLSTLVMNNSTTLRRVAEGGDVTTGVYERFQRYFDYHRQNPEAATSYVPPEPDDPEAATSDGQEPAENAA